MKKLNYKNALSVLLLLLTLVSCVEGRDAGRSIGSDGGGVDGGGIKEIQPDDPEVVAEIQKAYSGENFNSILSALKTLFLNKVKFTIPVHIYKQVECSAIGAGESATLNQYKTYILNLEKADVKYNTAIGKVNTKRDSETNLSKRPIWDEVIRQLLEESQGVKDRIVECSDAVANYSIGPQDCLTEAAKTQAAESKLMKALDVGGINNVITSANTLFSTAPLISFLTSNDVHSKVDCAAIAKPYKAKTQDYVNLILKNIDPVIVAAKTFNNPDLSSSESCVKTIAEKVNVLINNYQTQNTNKIVNCNEAIANVKPPVIYVGTDVGLSTSIDGGKTWRTAGQSAGVIGRVNGITVSNGVIYLATEGGVAISTDGGFVFKNYNNDWLVQVQNVYVKDGVIYASSWRNANKDNDNKNKGKVFTSPVGNISFKKTAGNGTALNWSISQVCIDDDKAMYLASNGGIGISLDLGATISQAIGEPSILGNSVKDIQCKGADLYAVTTKGLSISENGQSFIAKTKENSGLGSNDLRRIFVKDGYVYVANAGGLSISDGASNADMKFVNYKMPYMTGEGVHDVVMDSMGVIYAATRGGGLSIGVMENGVWKFSGKTPANSGIGSLNTKSVFVQE